MLKLDRKKLNLFFLIQVKNKKNNGELIKDRGKLNKLNKYVIYLLLCNK